MCDTSFSPVSPAVSLHTRKHRTFPGLVLIAGGGRALSEEAVSEPGEIRLLPNPGPDVRAGLRAPLGVVVKLAIKFVSELSSWVLGITQGRELIETRNEERTSGIASASFYYNFPKSCDSAVTLK